MKYCIENIKNIKDLDKNLSKIKTKKQNNINKVKNINDKKRKILGEILFIKGLKKFYSINYNDINIKLNKNGKPYISDKKYKNINFNISHSHDYSICVFSNKKIGVDIEKIRNVNLNILNQFATPNEISYVKSSKELILNNFFTIYTLKEAYFKMLGENLNNIKNVEFTITKNKIFCSDSNVKLKTINNIDGYIISICEKN